MTDKQPAQFDWATELSDAEAHVSLSEQEAHEIGARLRSMGAKLKTYEDLGGAADDVQLLRVGYAASRLEIESLKSERDRFRAAYHEWSDKTEWARKSTTVNELGKHLADVLRERIEGLQAALKAAQPVVTFQPGAAYATLPDESYGSIMGAAYDFRDAHISGSVNLKRSAHAELETAVRNALRASHGQAPAQATPAYKDSTPELHIGDSAFESWYSTYSPMHKSDKQRARDAYAAGMGDPLVTAAPVAVVGPSRDLHPEKCPITGRPFFMTLDHPELGDVPTYGGPYDSYTIPAPEGKPTDPWHERELCSERYDHDAGWWVEGGEPIPLRIVHEDVLFKLQEDAEAAAPTTQPAPAMQQAGECVYTFRRKGLVYFFTCDEARYEELSKKPNLFETRIFYTAPQPSPVAQGEALESEYQRGYRQGYEQRDAEVQGALV